MKREIDFMELGKQMGGITIGMAAAQAVDTKLATSLPSKLVRGGIFAGTGFVVAPMFAPKNDIVKNIGIGAAVYGIRLLAQHFNFSQYISGIDGIGAMQEYYQALPEMSGMGDQLLSGAYDNELLSGVEEYEAVEGIH